jgi:hypothetical protein
LRGVWEARSAFGVINVIRLPLSFYTFPAPLAAVYYREEHFASIAIPLALGHVVAFIAQLESCRRLAGGWV